MGNESRKIPYLNFLIYFIIIQPILDIVTYFSLSYLQTSLTIGIIIRVLFMISSLIYLFLYFKHRIKKYIIYFIILLFTVLGIGFIYNFFKKPEFHLFSEAQFLVKTIYFPVMICSFVSVFANELNSEKAREKFLKSVSIAMTIASLSLILAIITGTANSTYTFNKAGYTGWFYAGNEISAIIAICFPLVLAYSIMKSKSSRDILYWLPTLIVSLTSLWIGTKVSFFAVIISLVLTFIVSVINWFVQTMKKKGNIYTLKLVTLATFIISAVTLAAIPFSPAYHNVSGDYESLNDVIQNEEPSEEPSKDGKKPSVVENQNGVRENKQKPILQSKILRVILSARNVYFEKIYTDYSNAGLIHKFFGLGYAGLYNGSPKLIEMDFFDLFFAFGIVGFTVLILPLLVIACFILKRLFTNFRAFFRLENLLLLSSIGLGLCVSFIAGHVLFAPAVSIYLALSIAIVISTNNKALF